MKTPEQNAFEKLKPLCLKLIKQCTIANLHRLQHECDSVDYVSLQMLQEYLIFPSCISLKKETNENVVIECIKFMNFLLRKTQLQKWDLFHDVMGQIFLYLSGLKRIHTLQSMSEELKLAICECAETMILNSSTEIHEKLYSTDFCLPLAQYVYALVELLKKESSKSLRLSSMKTLSAFLYAFEEVPRIDSIISVAGQRLATFLPGVSVALCNIICGDVKQGHAIIVAAIKTFSVFITMTVGDMFVNENSRVEETSKGEIPFVVRNLHWVKEISGNIEIIIRKITDVVSHEHWEVRLALVNCAEKILCNCSNNLSNCISPLLHLLFALNVDMYEEVAVASDDAIKNFSKHINSVKSFSSILEEDIFTISSKLIKVHLRTNDTQKLSLLKTLHGYFQLLGKSVNNLLYSLHHSDRFIMSLLNLIKYDYSDFNFLAEQTSNFDSNFSRLWPKQRFKYFHDDEIVSRISSVCQLLGCSGDISLLIDYLLAKHKSLYKNETVFLINNIIKGLNIKAFPLRLYSKERESSVQTTNTDNEYIKNIVSTILESFLSPELWKIPFTGYCEASSESPETYKESILQVCLILECIATCSQILETDFQPFLMKVLCPVIEKAGCSNLIVSHSGKLTLHSIANSNGYDSITDLIVQNSDYLVNSITTKLHCCINEFEVVIVLKVTLEYCNIDVLPLFKDSIYQMLQTLDLKQEKALVIMKVFKAIVNTVGRWFSPMVVTKNHIKFQKQETLSTSLKLQYLEHHHLKMVERSFLDESDDNKSRSDDINENFDDEKHDATPLHVEIVTAILDRCVHMMSSKHLELSSLTLEVIGASILALKNDIDKVLPYVHKIWSPLVSRFSGNLVVSIKAFETLVIIANECGDFVKARTMKDVWPKFLTFLKSQLKISKGKRKSTDYSMTTAYKFQFLILSEIGNLARKLDLTEKEIEMLAFNCLPYLNKNQPDSLQEAARRSLDNLASVDSDAVWFHFNEFYGIKKEIIPPNSKFVNIHFALRTCDEVGDYLVT